MNNRDSLTEKMKVRENLTSEIVADIADEIDAVLMWAPESLAEDERTTIRDEAIAQTRLVTEALSLAELQDAGARRAYTCGAVASVRHMINLRIAQNRNR